MPYGKFVGFCGRQLTFDKTNMGSELTTGTGYSGSELEGTIMMGNTFDYVALHGKGISQLRNHSFCSCSEEALLAKVIVPREYTMIDIIYGVQTTFRPATTQMLNDYCAKGGNLLVSGANLHSDATTHQGCATDVVSDKSITSINGSNLEFTIYREMNPQSYAVPRVTAVSPAADTSPSATAFAMLQYSNNQPAAVAYEDGSHRKVTVGFPIESIREADMRNALMRAITNFLCK